MLTILIVDDEPAIVELVRVTLEDERVRVLEAGDGESALIEVERACPDLVFLDVHLPDMSGLDVCRRLCAEAPRRPKIVLLTAAAQSDDVARGLAAGADHYLTKPFSPVGLLSMVETMIPRAPLWPRQ